MSIETYYVSRVNQLDAVTLDNELLATLMRNLLNGLEYIQHNWLLSLEPEIMMTVRLLIWHWSVNTDGATVGQKLFELGYVDLKAKRLTIFKSYSLAVLRVILPWVRERLTQMLSLEKVHILESLDVALRLAGVLNFVAFLRQGTYSSLVERILSLKLSHSRPQEIRQVQYEYMNRELLWNGIADFISFIIPLVNLRRIQNTLLYAFCPKVFVPSLANHRTLEDFGACALCGDLPIAPHDMGCRHIFCYYCLVSAVIIDPKFHCPVCHHQADGRESVCVVTVTNKHVNAVKEK